MGKVYDLLEYREKRKLEYELVPLVNLKLIPKGWEGTYTLDDEDEFRNKSYVFNVAKTYFPNALLMSDGCMIQGYHEGLHTIPAYWNLKNLNLVFRDFGTIEFHLIGLRVNTEVLDINLEYKTIETNFPELVNYEKMYPLRNLRGIYGNRSLNTGNKKRLLIIELEKYGIENEEFKDWSLNKLEMFYEREILKYKRIEIK